jgi:hypothetical protein
VACETSISPNELLDAPEGIFEAMIIYLKERAKNNGE